MTLPALAIASLFIVTLGYVGLCASSPFGTCRRCRGFGFKTRTDRRGREKRGKDCRHCKGTGRRIRVGRHLFNVFSRTWHQGTR